MEDEETLALDWGYITLINVFFILIYTRTASQPSLTPILSVAIPGRRDATLVLEKARCQHNRGESHSVWITSSWSTIRNHRWHS